MSETDKAPVVAGAYITVRGSYEDIIKFAKEATQPEWGAGKE